MIYFPHENAVVLGGTVDRDNWDTTPRPETAERILRDCAAVEPRVLGAEVLAHHVGLRPSRPEVRLEAEPLDGGGVLWHNYGHGSAGVTLFLGMRAGDHRGGSEYAGPGRACPGEASPGRAGQEKPVG